MSEILYVVIPAYNEEDNIRDIVISWYQVLEGKNDKSKLVVADTGSIDKTHDILNELKNSYSSLEILETNYKEHGPKVIALYKYAIKNGADYIFQTDSDGQTDPSDFDCFWKQRKDFDGIFGWRKVRGDGRHRAFIENVVCVLLKIYFGVKIPDANAPFRLMNADVLDKYISRLDEDYNIPNIMITTFFVYYQEKSEFLPVMFRDRKGGHNSIDIRKIIEIGWKALYDFRYFKRSMKRGY